MRIKRMRGGWDDWEKVGFREINTLDNESVLNLHATPVNPDSREGKYSDSARNPQFPSGRKEARG